MDFVASVYQFLSWDKMLYIYTFIANFIAHYLAAGIILEIYREKVTLWQKVFFALLGGVLMHNGLYYAAELVNNSLRLQWFYTLFAMPNPVFAMLYYFIGCKIFRLPYARAIRLMNHAYMYVFCCQAIRYVAKDMMLLMFGGIAPPQGMHTTAQFVVIIVAYLLMSRAILYFVHKAECNIDLVEAMPVKSVPAEAARSLIWLSIGWGISFYYMQMRMQESYAFIIFYLTTVFSLFAINLMWDTNRVARAKLQNKAAYISALVKSMDDFRAFRHDFKNILQTYGGYIALDDMPKLKQYHETVVGLSKKTETHMELTKRMTECPATASLLIEKLNYAEKCGVDFQMQFGCSLYITEEYVLDCCRFFGCLVDNAIEAAADSERKMVVLTWDQKPNGNRLLVLTNSTKKTVDPARWYESGFTTKENHTGLGLSVMMDIVGKHPNCSLNVTSYQNEVSVYVEVLAVSFQDLSKQKNADSSIVSNADQQVMMHSEDKTEDCQVDFSKLTFLLVDDNFFLMDSMKKYLESLKITVDTAENGLEGLNLYQEAPNKYDLIFLDIEMPVMGGIEAATRIRESGSPTAKTTPLIAVTGSAFPYELHIPLFDSSIRKPFVFEDLDAMIRQTMCKRKERSASK